MAASSKAGKDHHANLKTVPKWLTELNCPLEYDISSKDFMRLPFETCKKQEKRITSVKGFSQTWIRWGTNSIKKDVVKSHVKSAMHKKEVNLQKRNQMGALPIFELLYKTRRLDRGFAKCVIKTEIRYALNLTQYII